MQSLLSKPPRLGNTRLILIDGPAGAGKTTLATKLSIEFSAQVIHLDSLYDGWENALTQTLTDNLIALCKSIQNGDTHSLPIYNWSKMIYEGYSKIEPTNTLIIEGVGAGQSAIREYATALIWIEIEPELGFSRVIARDGDSIAEQIKVWQEREAAHFEKEQTRKFADFHYSTT